MISDYPRPQLVRNQYVSLDGDWLVAAGKYKVEENYYLQKSSYSHHINVPFPPESKASGINEDFGDTIWYWKDFEWEKTNARTLLNFEGVDFIASVWVNGHLAGEHEGGQSRFTLDVTQFLQEGSNSLVIRAVDGTCDLEQPRGKQDWMKEQHVIWYRRTTGIWRSVWMESVPETYIEALDFIVQPDLQSIEFRCRVAGPVGDGCSLTIRMDMGGQVLCDVMWKCTSHVFSGIIRLEHDRLDAEGDEVWWTPDNPRLVKIYATLKNGKSEDSITSYTGLRTVDIDESHVLLNGHPIELRLVLEQGYWTDTNLSSPSTEALWKEASLIKQMGFNGLRMHQTSADPRFLEACDQLGLLVFADVAATYRFSDVSLKRLSGEFISLVQRDINHPSVVGWVPFNESWGVPNLRTSEAQRDAVRMMYYLAKAIDPSRLACGNDGWQYVVGDIVGIHDYSQQPEALQRLYGTKEALASAVACGKTGGRDVVVGDVETALKRPVLISEFGGISSHDDDDAWRAYGKNVKGEKLPQLVGVLVSALSEGGAVCGFCYTQFSDTDQEKNGLVTADRKPKCDVELLRQAITHEK